jgi:hypothetical protein
LDQVVVHVVCGFGAFVDINIPLAFSQRD